MLASTRKAKVHKFMFKMEFISSEKLNLYLSHFLEMELELKGIGFIHIKHENH